ncbi:DNA-binding HxlR family transcriptional regulator [Saccharothrix ecbatanensis]|jgi:DNA-binding HxlR family transcriptional regulator|uniref:DNA-binding HxlR family transcriptional regulator n=1 Tax=Saccharothrix ecbatanensis TaxID=1105145 RepID=A0A7W9LY02_9PSEU|nr:helix-turn-helix domain-containing protein [Saccharothrix ecbatanensis]MBB5800365.1 DNA-binding HxlR family transcriptional regulator [Saccharothrix ecbatanensis]
MRDYAQYCPVALASAVLADRWTPLIVRELVLGSRRFNDIDRGLPGISRSLLQQRLHHLERKGVLERIPVARGHEYQLTPAGKDLEGVIMAIGEWAVRWMFAEPQPREVDPVTLTWWLSRRLDHDRLPDQRVVVEFDYRGDAPARLWLVLEKHESSVCTEHPGFPSDVVVTTAPVALMRVFSGITTLARATAGGEVVVTGTPRWVRALGDWFLWSPFAPAVRERLVGA